MAAGGLLPVVETVKARTDPLESKGHPVSKAKMPNIVFILTDDQGTWALGCAGSEEIRTPNLDGLAGGGGWYTIRATSWI